MRRTMLAVFSAAFLILSFPNFNFYIFAWFAFIPLLFVLEKSTPRQAFRISFLAGVLFFFGTIYWLIHVTLPGMVIVVLYLALYFGIFGFVSTFGYKSPGIIMLFFIPSLWVAVEWTRSHLLGGFGWGLLAHSQGFNLPVIQIADITGAYGVSFLVMMFNVALYLTIKNFIRKRYSMAPLILATAVLFIVLCYGYFRLNNVFVGEDIKVAVVQGNIPQAKKWEEKFRNEILITYESLTRGAAREKPDLIVWPEASVHGFLESERDLTDRVKSLSFSVKTPLLVGTPRLDKKAKEIYYNSAILFSEEGRIADSYYKMRLVPFGEYIPFKSILFFLQRFSTMPIGDFTAGEDYTVFKFIINRTTEDGDNKWRLMKKVRFSCLICFEDIFPDLARRFISSGADFLVNITNDAWFGNTSAPYQHAQCSVFRAIENRVNVIRSANTGLSCFIDQKGTITGSVSSNGRNLFVGGVKSCDIVLTKTRTFYNARGDVFTYACLIFVLLYIFAAVMKKRKGIWELT